MVKLWKIAVPLAFLPLKTWSQLVNLITPGMTITTSATITNQVGIEKLIDGAFDDVYDPGVVTPYVDWIQIDLGSTQSLRTLYFHVRDPINPTYPSFYTYLETVPASTATLGHDFFSAMGSA